MSHSYFRIAFVMLSKKHKLPIQHFIGVRPQQTVRSPYFTLKIFSTTLLYSRFGVVISKKVFAKATQRNQLKRLFFGHIQGIISKLPKADYLFIFSPVVAKLEKEEVGNEMDKILNPNAKDQISNQ